MQNRRLHFRRVIYKSKYPIMDYLTALNQLTRSERGITVLKLFIGAHDFVRDVSENSIAFKFRLCPHADYCRIRLNSMDLYDMDIRLINPDFVNEPFKPFSVEKSFSGLYFDQLKEIFENYTGLALSL